MLSKRNFLKTSSNSEYKLSKNNNTFSSKNSYSQALFELASESNLANDIENQVSSILELIRKSEDIKEFIKDPTNKIEDQLKIINVISDQFKFNELLKKFLGFTITKRKFFYIEKILNDFLFICSNSRGEIQAELSAAKNLNESEINKIKDELSSTFGSNIKLNHKYDPNLIGGLIIKVGSTMIDTSIKSKLQKIEKKMIEV
jgi:F-type H+-transporting ATPase subunit delta